MSYQDGHHANGGYDENLAKSAPAASSAQMQNLYDTDLLAGDSHPERTSTGDLRDTERGVNGKEYAPLPPNKPRKQSFFRTRNGIITLVVISIVIIAAVVGGAVGGTRHKSNNNSLASATSTSGVGSAGSGGATAGVGNSVPAIGQSQAGVSGGGGGAGPTSTNSQQQTILPGQATPSANAGGQLASIGAAVTGTSSKP